MDIGQNAMNANTCNTVNSCNATAVEEAVLKFNAIYNSVAIGIGIYDENGILTDCNSELLKIFGIEDKQTCITSKISFERDPNFSTEVLENLKLGASKNEIVYYDFDKVAAEGLFETKHAGCKTLEIRALNLINSKNKHIGYLSIINDITHLRHQEMVHQSIYNNIPVGVELYDRQGRLVYLNPFNIKTFGIENFDEVEGLNLFDEPNTSDEIKNRIRAGENFEYELEYDFDLKNQKHYRTLVTGKRYFWVKNVAIRNEQGEVEGYLMTNSDITEQRVKQQLLEDTQRSLALALKTGNVTTWEYDVEKQTFSSIVGSITPRAGVSLEQTLKTLHPEDTTALLEMIDDIVSARTNEGEIILRFFDPQQGDYRYFESRMAVRLDGNGDRAFIAGTQRDITKKCLGKLEIDNARRSLDMALATSKVLAWDYDLHTKKSRILYGENFGKTAEGDLTKNVHIHPEDTQQYGDLAHKVAIGQVEEGSMEIRVKNEEGVYRHFDCSITGSRNKEGKITHLIGSYIDISQRRERERAERDLKTSLEIIMDAGEVSVWRYNIAERKFYAMLGDILMPEGTTYETCAEAIAEDGRANYHEIFHTLISGKKDKEHTIFHFINPETGADIFYRNELAVLFDEKGNRVAVIGTQKDITADMIQKRRLEEFKIKTDLTNEKNHIIQWDYDVASQFIITQGKGAIQESVAINKQTYLSFIHPEDQQIATNYLDRMSRGEQTNFDIILRAQLPDYEEYRYIVLNAVALKDSAGAVVSYTGIRRDATEEILLRKELEEKTYKTTLVTKARGFMPWEYDCKRHQFISNDNDLLGREMTLEDYMGVVHASDAEKLDRIWDIIRQRRDESFSIDLKYKFFDQWRYATIAGEPYERDASGRVTRYLGYRNDTTDMVLMNEHIRENKFKTDMAMKNANMVMWEYSVEEKAFTAFNDPLTHYDSQAKYTPEEYLAALDPDSVKDAEKAVAFMNRQEKGEFSFKSKIMLPNSDQWQYVTIHGSHSEVCEDDPSKAKKYVGFRIDNTELVKLSQGLEESNALTSSILAQSPSAIFIKDITNDWRYMIGNDLFCQLFNYTEEQIIGYTDHEIFDKQVADKFREDDLKALAYNGVYSFVEEVITDGKVKAVHTTKRTITIGNGRQLLIGITSDITETLARQRALEQANEKSDLVLNSANVGLIYIDNDFRIVWENVDSIEGNPHILAYKRGQVCYKSVHGLDAPCPNCVLMRAKESRQMVKETKIYDDGMVMDIFVNPVIGEDNQINGYVCRMDDVTEKHKQQTALEKSHQDLNLALEAGNVSTWLYKVDEEKLYSLQKDTHTGEKLGIEEDLKFIHPDDKQVYLDLFEALIQGRQDTGNVVFRYKADNVKGGYRYYENRMIAKKEEGRTVVITGTQKDITDDVLKTKQLRDTQKYLDLAIKAGKVSVWGYNPRKDVVFNISGKVFDTDVLPFSDAVDYIHPDDLPQFQAVWQRLVGGESQEESICLRFRNPFTQKMEYVDKSMIAVRSSSGELDMLIGTHHDITEDKLQKMALEDSNEKLNMALDVIQAFSWHCDLRNEEVLFDSNFTSLGLDAGVMNSIAKFVKRIHIDDRQEFLTNVNELLQKEEGEFISTYRVDLHGNGVYEWWECRGKMKIMCENGQCYKYVYGMNCNVTHHVQITEELTKAKIDSDKSKEKAEEASSLLQSIVRQIPFGLYIKDIGDDFRYVIMNDVLTRIDGIEEVDIVGKTDAEIFSPEVAQMFREESALAASKPDGELTVVKSTIDWHGQKCVYENSDTVITVANGRRLLLGVVADVTEKERMLRELQEAKERAEQSDKLKSAFLANMSHEIRTPLNAIVGFSELLVETDDYVEREEYTNIISVNNELLLRLIGDILDLSKIESGMIELKSERFDISEICDEVYMMFKQKITNPDVEFVVENPYHSCIVELDKNRMKQVGINFITNAIKYTAKGLIKMGYQYVDQGIKIYVQDSGIGISEKNHAKVFERFEKFDTFAQGTGLGLSICKAIVDVQGGEIGFDSEEGKGSYFWAWFPCEAVIEERVDSTLEHTVADSAPAPELKETSNFKILIAEDNDSNFMLMKHLLKAYRVTRACNGAQAVELAQNEKFNVILMDWKMPVMDGLEATLAIRGFDQKVPIIAVTANAFDANKVTILEAGCNTFVAKPLKKQELYDAIAMVSE